MAGKSDRNGGWSAGSNRTLPSRGSVPLLVIDGRPFTWEEVGRIVMTFEGSHSTHVIEDTIELADDPERTEGR